MAFAYVADRGIATSDAASTTVVLTVDADVVVGRLLILWAVSDNETTAAEATTNHAVEDSQGNSWTRLVEYTMSAGAAFDGVTVSIWRSVIATQLTGSTDTITLTTNNLVVQCIMASEFTTAGIDGVLAGVGATGTSTSPSVTDSGQTERDYLWLGAVGREYDSASTFTQDAGFTDPDTNLFGVDSGGPLGDASAGVGYNISSGTTGDTYAPTIGNAADWACVLVGLYEAAGGETHQLAGQSDGVSTTAGALFRTRGLAGETVGQSAASALLGLGFALAGQSDGASGTSGVLTPIRTLAGQTDGVSGAAGALFRTRGFAGTSAGTSAVSGALGLIFSLIGQTDGVGVVSGTLTTTGGGETHELAATVAAVSGASASLLRTKLLAGQSDAVSTAAAALLRTKLLSGSSAGVSTAAGTISRTLGLVATSAGVSGVSGEIALLFTISGQADAVASVVGELTVAAAIYGMVALELSARDITLTLPARDIDLSLPARDINFVLAARGE